MKKDFAKKEEKMLENMEESEEADKTEATENVDIEAKESATEVPELEKSVDDLTDDFAKELKERLYQQGRDNQNTEDKM